MMTSTPQSSADVYVGRQPIYDVSLNVVGYELLYRRGDTAEAGQIDDDDSATLEVVTSSLIDIGLDALVGGGTAYVNVTPGFLRGPHARILPPDRVVLELLERSEFAHDLLSDLRAMRRAGYRIALDDFVYRPDTEALLEVADIVKLDVLALGGDLEHEVERVRGRGLQLIAEKVETHEEAMRCRLLGFDYLQGFFFCRPVVVLGRRLSARRLPVLRLLAELQRPGLDLEGLQDLVSQDMGLSYKVLQVINSASLGLRRSVGSLRDAIILLGTEGVRSLATLTMLSSITNKPTELTTAALLRARMCERLAVAMGSEHPETSFTVGLFSLLDAFLDADLEEAVAALPLDAKVADALLFGTGEHGDRLAAVIAYERGDLVALAATPVPLFLARAAYFEAARWASDTSSTLDLTARDVSKEIAGAR